jgi:putative hydrolase of the HAD superfamily
MKKRVLKALFLDVDDTLYSSSEFSAMARLNSVKAMINNGLRMELKECLLVLKDLMLERPSNYKYLFDDLLKAAGKERYPRVNKSVLIASAVVAYHNTKNTSLRPYPDVKEVLKILSDTTPLRLGVISSGLAVKQAEKIYRCGLHRYLDPDAIFFSETLGVDKPREDFFRLPCRRIGVDPGEAVYVGDRPNTDVGPAKSVGMISVLNQRSGKYLNTRPRKKPDFIVHDFWELLECLNRNFKFLQV